MPSIPLIWFLGSHRLTKALIMINRMMFALPFQGLVAPKGIREIDRPLSGLRLDMFHEFLGTDRLDDFGVDAVFPLQEPKADTFACRRSASRFPLRRPPK